MFLNGKISNRQNREMGSLRGVVDMALKKPNSMEECIYFTRRAVDSGKIMAWVFREACSKCKQGLMGKPVDAKTGSAKIRALEYVCPSCKYTVPKAEYEDTLTCNVEYICPKCKKSGEATAPFKRKTFQGVPAIVFECSSCKEKIGITKKMKATKKSKKASSDKADSEDADAAGADDDF